MKGLHWKISTFGPSRSPHLDTTLAAKTQLSLPEPSLENEIIGKPMVLAPAGISKGVFLRTISVVIPTGFSFKKTLASSFTTTLTRWQFLGRCLQAHLSSFSYPSSLLGMPRAAPLPSCSEQSSGWCIYTCVSVAFPTLHLHNFSADWPQCLLFLGTFFS